MTKASKIAGTFFGMAALLTGIFYLKHQAVSLDSAQLPCEQPLTYRIGEIDDRFGISDGELRQLMTEVSEIWSEATGNSVIVYDHNGSIEVNLYYAEQQQLTDSERQYRDLLRAQEQVIAVEEREYRQMNQRFSEMEQSYRQDSNRLENEIELFNNWVNQINNDGGFDEAKLEMFETRKREIDQKNAGLDRRAVQLQQEAERLNRKVDDVNRRIDQKNSMINEYNQIFTGTKRFTQGSYEYFGNMKKINVYQFSHLDELRLVLAHEVGHALGIDHVENPQSIMYHLMGNQALTDLRLTDEDIRALHTQCGF